MKTYLIALVALIIVGAGFWFFLLRTDTVEVVQEDTTTPPVVKEEPKVEEKLNETPIAEPESRKPFTVIGSSVGDRDITAFHYGSGEKEVLFVGGIHGGYEWNTSLVAYELMDYLEENPEAVPEGVTVTVVPTLNPDGLYKIVGKEGRFAKSDVPTSETATIPGRFNANTVDLNRNFDCDWQSSGTWQNKTVSGGTKAFSEPESQALRDYVIQNVPEAVVVWYSAAGGVYASNCHNGVLPETTTLTNLYAKAAGYPAYESFDYYEITGDAVNWLAKMKIPGISVLLTTHSDTEWSKNKAGVEAILKHYAE